jgi:hypothetical protein
MAEEDREQIAKLTAKLELQQAARHALLKQVKKAVAPNPTAPDPCTPERRKSTRPKKSPR